MKMTKPNNNANKISTFIKGSSILVLSNVCLKAINFFLLPLYTNNLTPEMIGISDSITTFTGIVLPLLTMGLDSAYSAFYFEKDDIERGNKVFSTLTYVFVIIGCIPFFLFFFSRFISLLLFHSEQYSYIIRLSLASVSFSLWSLTYSLELRLNNKMFLFGLSNVIASLSMIVSNIVFVTVMHLGESSLVLSTVIVHAEIMLILLIFTRKRPKFEWFNIQLLKQMIRFAVPLVPMTLMMWVLSLSDRYILLHYHGNAEVGLYGIGLRFTNLMNVVISAVSVAYTTFAFSSKDDGDSKKQYYYVYSIESVLLIIVAFTIGLFGKEIIQIMTAETYKQSYVSLRDLLFSQVFYAMASIVGYGIFFEKKSGYSLLAVSTGAAVNLVLNIYLIPQYGIAAAAFTTLLGYAIHFFITLVFSEKLYPCEYGQHRVITSLVLLYAVCFITGEAQILTKVLVWVVCIIGIIILYRDILAMIKTLLIELIYKINCKRIHQEVNK